MSAIERFGLPQSYVNKHRLAVKAIMADIRNDGIDGARDISRVDDADIHYYVIESSYSEAARRFSNISQDGDAYDRVLDWRTAVEADVFGALDREHLEDYVRPIGS